MSCFKVSVSHVLRLKNAQTIIILVGFHLIWQFPGNGYQIGELFGSDLEDPST